MIILVLLIALSVSYPIWKFFGGKEIEEDFSSFFYHVGLAGALIGFLLFWLGFVLLSLFARTFGITIPHELWFSWFNWFYIFSLIIGTTLWSYYKNKILISHAARTPFAGYH